MQQDREEKKAVDRHIIPVSDFRFAKVEEFFRSKSLAPNTIKAYRRDLQYFLNWTDKTWSSITNRDVANYKQYLYSLKLADSSIARILVTLKNFYNWLQRSDYLDKIPTKSIDLPKLPEPKANNLSDEAVVKILEAAGNNSRDLALILVLLHGLRANEALGLNVEDVDFEREEIKIGIAKADSTGKIPLHPDTVAAIEDYLLDRGVFLPCDPLFLSHSARSRGKRLTYQGLVAVLERLSERTEVNFSAHNFRHTFGTNCILKGMSPYHVQSLLRHRSQKMTRRYTQNANYEAARQDFKEKMSSSFALNERMQEKFQ